MSKRIVVAIDGPSGAGKSTIARRLASRLGFLYIDTGAMYRAVGLWALRLRVNLSDMHRLEQLAREARIELGPGDSTVFLNGEDISEAIRTQEIADAASRASAVPGVRRAMVEKQREMASRANVVMEGRDIGTVVFPGAPVKVYLDATPEVRAGRRVKELREKGLEAHVDEIAGQIRERDRRDSTRADSPLMQANDAVYVDSSGLDIGEVEEAILRIVRDRTSNGKDHAS
ncbi:MAG TPA: (d)CMP kinase [Bryobacteraceae bacterium]|nr:(d)CMP kinase [Bryobacteraceae bacterium]